MKKIVVVLLLMLSVNCFVMAQVVVNQDSPTKGIWKFDPVLSWEVMEGGDDVLTRGNVVVGQSGNSFFLEIKTGRVHIFNKSGKYIKSFGSKGEGPGESKNPFKAALAGNKIVVVGIMQINYFSQQGDFIESRKIQPTQSPLSFIDENNYIFKSSDENGMDSFNLFDIKNSKVTKLCEFDLGGKKSKGLNMVGGTYPVCVDSDFIYYAKNETCEIVKLDQTAKQISSSLIKNRKKKKVSKEQKRNRISPRKRKQLKGYSVGGKSAVEAIMDSMPDEDPYYKKLTKLENGLILAFHSGAKNGYTIDVFSPKGEYLYQGVLQLPDSIKMKNYPIFNKDSLIVFTEDEDGELNLRKYKIKIPKV